METTKILLIGLSVLACSAPAFAEDPGSADSVTMGATLLQESVEAHDAGDFERSLRTAQEALRILDQKTAIAYNNICVARMRLGDYEQAIRACDSALELAPGFERARNNLEWIYEILAEQSPTVGVYLNLGLVRYWQGDLDASIDASEKALEIDPASAIAHNNLCAAYATSERWEKAVRECEMALEIDPDFERAKNNLAWAQTGGVDDGE